MGIHNMTPPNNNNNNSNSNNGAGGGSPIIGIPIPGGSGGAGSDVFDPMDYLIDYNQKFKTAAPTLFRDSVVFQLCSVLIGKNKPNALLIGPAGSGKTRIVEELARLIAIKSPILPDALLKSNIYELPLSSIVSGSSYVGQVEAKLDAVLDFAKDPANNAILFIDEIHQLAEGSGSSQYSKIAQILKPALSRGNLHVIGATTTQEAGNLRSDPALNRRFSKIKVDELTKEQTIQILISMKTEFFAHYKNKISIDDAIFPVIVDIAEDYHEAGMHRPDNAITLLDRTIGEALMERKQQEIQAKTDPMLQQMLSMMPTVPIREKQVRATAIRMTTGNSKPETLNLQSMQNALMRIKGQDDIIDELLYQIRKHEADLFPKTAPMTLLFIGPSGVGKTEVTKIIAKELTGMEPITLNMTEYHSPASINRIIGAPAGYVGSDSNQELPFDALISNPYQIILLDEFEKCDPAVKTLFMQVFDSGLLKTNQGQEIDFSKSIIIATTNAGYQERQKSLGFVQQESSNETAISDLSQHFDLALLNRFNKRITFHTISKEIYGEILSDIYAREVARIKTTHTRIKLADNLPDDDRDRLVKETYVPDFGARPAGKAIEDYILQQVI